MADDSLPQFVPNGLVTVDADGRVTDANDVFLAWAQIDKTALFGTPLELVLGVERDALAAALSSAADAELPVTTMLNSVTDRERAITLASSVDPGGRTVVAVMDATLQRAFEDDLVRREALSQRESQRLQLLLSASVAFADATTHEELGAILADVSRQSFAASSSSVHMIEDGKFETIAGFNPMAPYLAQSPIPMGARAVDLGRAFKIEEPDEADALFPDARVGNAMLESGTRAVIASPILDHGTPIGALACFFDFERHFDEQAEPLIRALAQQAAPVFVRLRLEAEMRRASMLDEVTDLPSRRLLEQSLLEVENGRASCSAVLFLDLDGFKRVNDALGHAAGDRLLREVADRLRATFRAEDAVARYGGDEFVAVLSGVDPTDAAALAERARASIAGSFDWIPADLAITASIGLAINRRSPDALPPEAVIRIADHAMYAAKTAGGNRVATENA